MGYGEAVPIVTLEYVEEITESIFLPDGSLNEVMLHEEFGLGIEEASQVVSFGAYTGTVAQMIDPTGECPVSGMVRKAYKEKGIEGVDATFKNLGEMDQNFSVKITKSTFEREKKKKMSQKM